MLQRTPMSALRAKAKKVTESSGALPRVFDSTVLNVIGETGQGGKSYRFLALWVYPIQGRACCQGQRQFLRKDCGKLALSWIILFFFDCRHWSKLLSDDVAKLRMIFFLWIEVLFLAICKLAFWQLGWNAPYLLILALFAGFTFFVAAVFRSRFPLDKFRVDRVYYTLGIFAVVFFSLSVERDRQLAGIDSRNDTDLFLLRRSIEELAVAQFLYDAFSSCPNCVSERMVQKIHRFSPSPSWMSRLHWEHCRDTSLFEGPMQELYDVHYDIQNDAFMEAMRVECEDVYRNIIPESGWPSFDDQFDLTENLPLFLILEVDDIVSLEPYLTGNWRLGRFLHILFDPHGKLRDPSEFSYDHDHLINRIRRNIEDITVYPAWEDGDDESSGVVDLLRLNIWPFIVVLMLGSKLARPET